MAAGPRAKPRAPHLARQTSRSRYHDKEVDEASAISDNFILFFGMLIIYSLTNNV